MSTATNDDLRAAVDIAKTEAKAPATRTVFDAIRGQQKAIERALPSHVSAERFTRIAVTEVRRVPKLAQCSEMSLLAAFMVSAQLGLEPGPQGHVYFVPFGNQVQLIIGYRGYIDLAFRSGRLASLSARDVCEHDEFDFAYGLDERLEHRPARSDRGALTDAYAVAKFATGGHAFVVLSREEVMKRKARSSAANGKSSPWTTDEQAMWRKSAVRALVPFLPLSPEIIHAQQVDEKTLDRMPASLDDLDVMDLDSDEVDPDEAPDAG